MGQKTITIELTEYQARVVRWAVNRALMVTPERIRGRVFMQKLTEADERIQQATLGLEEIPLPPALVPKLGPSKRAQTARGLSRSVPRFR